MRNVAEAYSKFASNWECVWMCMKLLCAYHKYFHLICNQSMWNGFNFVPLYLLFNIPNPLIFHSLTKITDLILPWPKMDAWLNIHGLITYILAKSLFSYFRILLKSKLDSSTYRNRHDFSVNSTQFKYIKDKIALKIYPWRFSGLWTCIKIYDSAPWSIFSNTFNNCIESISNMSFKMPLSKLFKTVSLKYARKEFSLRYLLNRGCM